MKCRICDMEMVLKQRHDAYDDEGVLCERALWKCLKCLAQVLTIERKGK